MPTTITIRRVPDEIHERLKERAARHRRSLNSELLKILEEEIGANPPDVEATLEEIDRINSNVDPRSGWEPDQLKKRMREGLP